ncbi:hypothetical protein ACFSTE_09345 [Aquimarina hainanensis]|uniref:DUF2383 domain-containing protein n=1 Tax=Aquimarina hainanensis TaxID=1578017 RepID=A0ABW5N5X4_9FLAO
MSTDFPYTSLHEYLDIVFGAIENPTIQQIKDAKKQYRKLYLEAYQKQRRERIKEFTLGFNYQKMLLIHKERGELSVSAFLYQCIYSVLKNQGISDTRLLGKIHASQLEIIDAFETLTEHSDSYILEVFLEKMETLETQIIQLKGT